MSLAAAWALFFKGWVIGLCIAIPVGPVGMLCIRNAMTYGMLVGLMSGLGAACADAIYAVLGGFGVVAIESFLMEHLWLFQLIGGLFLCFLGIKVLRTKPIHAPHLTEHKKSHIHAFGSTFLLTLANPLTILSFAAVYAGLGVSKTEGSRYFPILMTLGVFLGSALWWLFLSAASAYLRTRINHLLRASLNWISGSVILLFGLAALALAAWELT